MARMKDPIQRLLTKVKVDPESSCWLWLGALKPNGYPDFWFNGDTGTGHRAAMILLKNIDPGENFVCHRCDIKKCINPEHLFIGTAKENQTDMTIKGRGRFGSRAGSAKLTDQLVIKIRKLYSARRFTQYELASMFGVSQHAICSVVRGRTWAHLLKGGVECR